jgi:hypothetical protein
VRGEGKQRSERKREKHKKTRKNPKQTNKMFYRYKQGETEY